MTNVIDFLVRDHERLAQMRLEMGRSITKNMLVKDKVKEYIRHFELHEALEEKFLISPIERLRENKEKNDLLQRLTDEHHKIWDLIGQLWEAINSRRGFVQQAYFDLFAYTESHIREEEQVFFPKVSKLLGEKMIADLGEKAQKYYEHYHVQV
ncbi:MAG: hemerythrin domain-containing protein [Elusimicrobia bacterium]|nr:hemerythrin domain-containing protein [Elusimicrobiota bacterium]